MTDSLIRKEDAIKALGEEPMVWTDSDFELADRNRWEMDVEALKKLQPVPQDEMTHEQFKEYCRKRCLSVVTNEFVEEIHRMNELRQPKQTNCEYCHTDRDGYVFPLEKNAHAFIDRDKIILKAKGWRGEAKINYCPICGRRL